MDLRLYKAACDGDVKALLELLQEDPLILFKASLSGSSSESPLHIAASLGHAEFAKLMLMSPSFKESSRELNPERYLQIAKDQSKFDKLGLCFSKDREGRTPLHCAAINGNIHVVRELIFCCPESAKETTVNGETLLHLVVKNNNQYEVVISLLSLLDEMDLTNEIINYIDKDGNTILHLAAARKQQQVIDFLLSHAKVNVDAVNASGHTAADISTSMCSSESDNNLDINGDHDDHQRQINLITSRNEEQVVVNINHGPPLNSIKMIKSYEFESYKRDLVLLASMKNGVMILCSLFAICCLDSLLDLPGGYVTLDQYYYFNIFIWADVVCFVTSLITIPLAMLATSFDSFYWRAVNVTAGMMIGSAVLLYTSVFGWVTDIQQAATWTAKIALIMFILMANMLSRKTKSSGHENITDCDDDETLSTDIAGPSNGNKSSGSRRVEMSWKDKLESLQNAIIVICSLLATCCFDAIISPPGGVWQTRPSKEVFQAETPKNISAFPKAFVSMNITSTDLLAPNKAMSLVLQPDEFLFFLTADATCFMASLITIYLATLATFCSKEIIQTCVLFSVGVMLQIVMVSAGVLYYSIINMIATNAYDIVYTGLFMILVGIVTLSLLTLLVFVYGKSVSELFDSHCSWASTAKDDSKGLGDQLIDIMDPRLHVAACNGDVGALQKLLQEDPLVLSEATLSTCSSNSPLHIAALLGHTDFTKLVMSLNPELSTELNHQGYSPIHLASFKGHLQIVTELLNFDMGLCFLQDCEGRTPLHCAAIKGRVEVITHLMCCCPESAMEVTFKGETLLHLVVSNSQTKVMMLLISSLRELNLLHTLIDCYDEDGNTALQLAIARNHKQKHEITADETNIQAKIDNIPDPSQGSVVDHDFSWKDKLASLHNGIIVLCSLLATCCFDAIISPPGGVWQNRPSRHAIHEENIKNISEFQRFFLDSNTTLKDLLAPNKAMSMALQPNEFLIFLLADATCFMASLVTINLVTETTVNGETLLHLVVKNNNRYEVVISLLSPLDEMDLINEIINYVDKDGNTILHLAAARK
ncbi:hypothetical protein EZV62_020907 [Acer yangbiense]|uniref:PGG domain-containing protein n=1 Tax=Acer yangbiense TaxID=1000413 RepID=A0A5C7HFC9_9ROSI|nr:hypothetical protein EZV62_020907 [Acer yangbiense]